MKSNYIFFATLILTANCLLLPVNGFSQFCYAKNIPSDTVSYSITNADFNKDGFEDLASVNMGTRVSIFLGDGHGNFASPVKYDIGAMAMGMSVITKDFNNDGKVDLAVADMMNMGVSVLLGNGNGTFGASASFPVDSTPYMLVSADFNKDGNFDIATANNYSSNNVSVLLGNGNGTFHNFINYHISPSKGSNSIATADFNKDENPDLVIGNSDTNYVSIMLGHGDGSFASANNLVVGVYLSPYPQSVICTDLNADSNIDIVSANYGDNSVTVLSGNGNGTFAVGSSFSINSSNDHQGYQNPQSVIASDFNGDQKIDLATANLNSNNVSVLLNNGAGGFQAVASFAVGAFPYMLINADFNNDTAVDIVASNASSNEISLLLNCPAGRIDTVIKLDTIYAGITSLNQSSESLHIYPNPSNGNFQFVINNAELKEKSELLIFDIYGEKVFYSIIKQPDVSTINISDKPSGIYFLLLKSEKETIVKKLVIQK